MRVAVYVRVSSYQQVQTQTIAQQLERIQAQCASQGWSWNEQHVFRDDGVSGATLTRPGLDRLREQIASGAFEQLVITAPDRLARNYVHQMLLEEFERAGCQVLFVEHPMSKEPNDQLLLQIRGAVAEYERTLIAERLRRGRQHKYRAGLLLPWTQPPYGYTLDPDHPRSVAGVRPEPMAAAMVAEVFARYLEAGQSIAGVAKYLMRLQVPAPKGGQRWTHASVRRMLTNPAYTGMVYASRTQVRPIGKKRSPLTPAGRRRNGSISRPREDWIEVGQIPVLVSAELFEQVQAKLASNARFARRNNTTHQYLLRALVSCGHCRLACIGQTRRRYSYYTCAGKSHPVVSSRDERCRARLIPMQQLDELVWQDMCKVLSHPQTIQEMLERVQGGAWLPQELQARRRNVQRAQAALTQQVERLTQAYLEQVVGLEEYRRRRQEIEGRVAALAEQARELELQAERQIDIAAIRRHIEGFCERVRQGLDQATFEQKRQLVELLLDRVVVTDEEVEIRYVIPTTALSEQTRFYHLRSDYCRALSPDVRGGVPAGSSSRRSRGRHHRHCGLPTALQRGTSSSRAELRQSPPTSCLSRLAVPPVRTIAGRSRRLGRRPP